jgi:hypothetical protein
MAEQPTIGIFVRLGYWDVYRGNVAVLVRQFRRVLLIFGIMGALMFALFFFALLHPSPQKDWYQTVRDARPLFWVFGIPLFIVFVTPLLAARRVITDERIKNGVSYRFSDSGIHLESSVATSDLQWAAIRYFVETRSLFLLLPTKASAHILPIRCFENESDIAAARKLLRSNIPNSKLRLY